MMPSFFENVFAFLFLHIHIIFSYTTGILFAWAVSLTIDFFHFSRLTQNTSQWIGFYKKEHILLLLISCMAGLIFSFFYTYKFPNNPTVEIFLAIHFWIVLGFLRITEIIYKSMLFVLPTSADKTREHSLQYLWRP